MKANKFMVLLLLGYFLAPSCAPQGDRIAEHFIRSYKLTPEGKFCEIRDDRDPADYALIPATCGYEDILYKEFCFIGIKNKRVTVLTINGAPVLEGDSVTATDQYLIVKDRAKAYFYPCIGSLCGPAEAFEYVPYCDVVFCRKGQEYGAFDIVSGKLIAPPAYAQVIVAFDEDGCEGLYAGSGDHFCRISRDTTVKEPLARAKLKRLKADADAHDTKWPEQGCGMVKLTKLR